MNAPSPSLEDIDAFGMAASSGNLYAVKSFVDQYGAAIINEQDHIRMTALTWAAYAGHLDVVTFLLDNGADIERCGNDDRTALGWAVLNAKDKAVTLLLERGASLDAKDNRDRGARNMIKDSVHAGIHQAFEEWQKNKQTAETLDVRGGYEARLDALKKLRPPQPSLKKKQQPRP